VTPAQLSALIEPLREHIETRHLDGRAKLPDDALLLDWGVLDSLALADLMVYIEERFGLSVPLTAITPDNFRTLRAIAEMLQSLEVDTA
jgi:peptidyl carrier protein